MISTYVFSYSEIHFNIFVAVVSDVDVDVDECTSSCPVCDENANCKNTRGSYICSRKLGFTGDEKTCQGEKTNVCPLRQHILAMSVDLILLNITH